jgi:hypothetical protein
MTKHENTVMYYSHQIEELVNVRSFSKRVGRLNEGL